MGQGGQIKLHDRKNEDVHLLWSHVNNCSERLADPLGLPDIASFDVLDGDLFDGEAGMPHGPLGQPRLKTHCSFPWT